MQWIKSNVGSMHTSTLDTIWKDELFIIFAMRMAATLWPHHNGKLSWVGANVLRAKCHFSLLTRTVKLLKIANICTNKVWDKSKNTWVCHIVQWMHHSVCSGCKNLLGSLFSTGQLSVTKWWKIKLKESAISSQYYLIYWLFWACFVPSKQKFDNSPIGSSYI